MPSDKKRINLTIPDDIYLRLQEYKAQNGITNDATACLQLVVQQLNAQERSAAMLNAMRHLSMQQIEEITREGMGKIKAFADAHPKT